jgi:hypothetical protein
LRCFTPINIKSKRKKKKKEEKRKKEKFIIEKVKRKLKDNYQ